MTQAVPKFSVGDEVIITNKYRQAYGVISGVQIEGRGFDYTVVFGTFTSYPVYKEEIRLATKLDRVLK